MRRVNPDVRKDIVSRNKRVANRTGSTQAELEEALGELQWLIDEDGTSPKVDNAIKKINRRLG